MYMTTLFLLQAPAQAGGGAMMWVMLIAMFVIMYFFMIRPQNKKQKELNNFRKTLQEPTCGYRWWHPRHCQGG